MHTHIYERYSVTPRLLLTSPVRACGKTTLLRVLERLVARAERCDSVTAAAIYAAIDEERVTLLLDEADNLNVAAKGALQAVLHAGYQHGGSIGRMVRGKRKQYNVFAPIALAAIGTAWSSLPLLSRSIVIRMRRHDGSVKLRRLDPEDTRDLDAASIYVRDWIERGEISRDPPLPEELGDRPKDLWRPLIAIADASGGDWGERARAAAVALSSDLEQDLGVVLLDHIRVVFDRLAVDRIPSKTLVSELLALDIADGLYQECPRAGRPAAQAHGSYAGGDAAPVQHRTEDDVATASSTWRSRVRADICVEQFEGAWEAYCGDGAANATPRQMLRLVSDRDID